MIARQITYNPAHWLAALWLLLLGTTQGCTSSSPVKNKAMTIVGSWKKATQNRCAEKYPDSLAFEPNNLYRGEASAQATMHPVWDVGTYELKDHAIGLSTANDAVIWYALKVENETLTFRDPEGCSFQYKRE